MGQSLSKRFAENKSEVIEYARNFGVFSACDKYETGYISMSHFLEVETGNPDFGINPVFSRSNGSVTASNLVDAFINKVNKLQAENDRLKAQLNEIYKQLEYRKAQQALLMEPKILEVMKVLK